MIFTHNICCLFKNISKKAAYQHFLEKSTVLSVVFFVYFDSESKTFEVKKKQCFHQTNQNKRQIGGWDLFKFQFIIKSFMRLHKDFDSIVLSFLTIFWWPAVSFFKTDLIRAVGAGGAMATPVFDRSVKPTYIKLGVRGILK